MLDLMNEDALGTAQAARLIAKWRGGKPSPTTIWRWMVQGHRGVRLEALRTPKGWVTTRRALETFFATLTAVHSGEQLADLSAEAHDRERESLARLREAGVKC